MLIGVSFKYSDIKNNILGTDFNKIASLAENFGISSVTLKLTNENDLNDFFIQEFSEVHGIKLNLEIPISKDFQQFVLKFKPHACYIAPEKSNENECPRGVNVAGQMPKLISFIGPLFLSGINTGIIISPDTEQIQAAANTGVRLIEINASSYADSAGTEYERSEFQKLKNVVESAQKLNLNVKLGRGLTYQNIAQLKEIIGISELNIGHAVMSRALSVGFETAVRELKELID